jgi:GDPmannose 4,6-dehydratase
MSKMSSKKTIIVTGARGQSGAYLCDLLLRHGFPVVGTSHAFSGNFLLPSPLSGVVEIHELHLHGRDGVDALIKHYQPAAVFHLAARSSSAQLSDDPIASMEINGLSACLFLEAIRRYSPESRFVFASSSEIFAGSAHSPQTELTQPEPVNAYGLSKLMGMQAVKLYRDAYNLHASSAILFNHESPLRPAHYVTKKVVCAAVHIAKGLQTQLKLGDLEANRDWMHAKDAVRGLFLMCQADAPSDYLFASGVSHSVRQLCDLAFSRLGMNYDDYVVSEPDRVRRKESLPLLGHARKAQEQLAWLPSTSFQELVFEMIDHEYQKTIH